MLNLARHELGHCTTALLSGFPVHESHLGEQEGSCTITYPMSPETFRDNYLRDPRQAAAWLVSIITVIRAGSYSELWHSRLGTQPSGRDLAHLQRWRDATASIYAGSWQQVYAEAYCALQQWFKSPSVNKLFAEWAPFLATERYLGPQRLQMLFEDVVLCPPLRLSTIFPVVDRERTPVLASLVTTTTRHRAADPLLPSKPAPTVLRLPRPIPTAQNAEFLVYYLDDHRAASLLSIMHRESGAQMWAVVGPAGSWEFNDHAKAVAKFQQLNPERRMARR